MRVHQPLNQVLDTGVKVRLLRFLCQKGGEWSGRRLAAVISVPPTTAHHALRELREATVLEFKQTGNSFVYSLRDEHVLVHDVLRPLFQREARLPEQLTALLRQSLSAKLRAAVVSAALYGSVATGQERPASDIDLLVLVHSTQAKAAVQEALERAGQQLMHTFGNPLALYLHTVQEARQKVRSGLPVFKNILAHHQVLWGRPLQEALHGR